MLFRACLKIGDVPSGEGFRAAGKQFFRRNPDGRGGRPGDRLQLFCGRASAESQLRLMSRPCQMEGHPAREYLEAADQANGVNRARAQ